MAKLKEIAMITIVAVAFLLITGVAKAETTFTDFVKAWASVPGKIADHVKSEAADIKAYQTESWAEMKQKWPFKQNSSN